MDPFLRAFPNNIPLHLNFSLLSIITQPKRWFSKTTLEIIIKCWDRIYDSMTLLLGFKKKKKQLEKHTCNLTTPPPPYK